MIGLLTMLACESCAGPDSGARDSDEHVRDTACDFDCERISSRWADAFAECGVESTGPLAGCTVETAEQRLCQLRCIEDASCLIFTEPTGWGMNNALLEDYVVCVSRCPPRSG